MIITSEITKKNYKTVDACIEDERRFLEEQEKQKKEREAAKKNIDTAFKKVCDAWSEYIDTLNNAGYKVTSLEEMALLMGVLENE